MYGPVTLNCKTVVFNIHIRHSLIIRVYYIFKTECNKSRNAFLIL